MNYALVNTVTSQVLCIKLDQPTPPLVDDPLYTWMPLDLQATPIHDERAEKLIPADTVSINHVQRDLVVTAKTAEEIAEYDRLLLPLIRVTRKYFRLALLDGLHLKTVEDFVNAPNNEALRIKYEDSVFFESTDKDLIAAAEYLQIPIYPVFEKAAMLENNASLSLI